MSTSQPAPDPLAEASAALRTFTSDRNIGAKGAEKERAAQALLQVLADLAKQYDMHVEVDNGAFTFGATRPHRYASKPPPSVTVVPLDDGTVKLYGAGISALEDVRFESAVVWDNAEGRYHPRSREEGRSAEGEVMKLILSALAAQLDAK